MRIQMSLCAVGLLVASTVNASAFSASFRWCGSGPSPIFSLNDVPKGTTSLTFQMDDLDYSTARHGGGSVPYNGQRTIPCGALKMYSPPAPPNGPHSYKFTVTALGNGNSTLGTATFTRKVPEK